MTSLDTNVDNYTIGELMSIFDLDYLDKDEIDKGAKNLLEQIDSNNKDPKLKSFIINIKNKLINYNDSIDNNNQFIDESAKKQTDEWWKYEALPQKDKIQKDKVTDRYQKIDVYNDQHVPMNRDQLGVSNTYDVPVAQDVLNPNLKNITSRIINLDSQFRQAEGGLNSISTDYTLDLSDPLTDVVSIRVASIQIPYTWYVIDTQYGNTCFWVTNEGNSFKISIPPGNYTSEEFVKALRTSILNAGFTEGSEPFVIYNINTAKIQLNFDQAIDPNGNVITGIIGGSLNGFDDGKNPYFTFFDFSGEKVCKQNCFSQNFAFNNSLGWLMGFRAPIEPILSYTEDNDGEIISQGNTGLAVLDLIGPKYFIVVLDDFNQNHINNGLITITEIPNIVKLPSYYNPTTPKNCTIDTEIPLNQIANLTQLNPQTALASGYNPLSNGLIEKVDISYKKTQQVYPTAPRTLTQAQIYTINEIIKNREKNTSYRGKAPTASDTFAILPLKLGSMKTGELYSEFGGTLQENKRIYFGPVDIDRMHLKLLDDKGFVVDLHGGEWCLTIISENLYQY